MKLFQTIPALFGAAFAGLAAVSLPLQAANITAEELTTDWSLEEKAETAEATQRPPAYWLTCQGGATNRIAVAHDVDTQGIPGATAMYVYFRPAATAGNPGPGECVWGDRTFRSGEPAVLWIKSPRVEFAFQVTGDGRIHRDAGGLRLSVEGSTRSMEAALWNRVVQGVMTGQRFEVQVYNSGNRVMVVTNVR